MVNFIGQQLGSYRLIRLLGVGTFGEVYLGEHVHIGTSAAIKVLLGNYTPQDKDDFKNEARTIAALKHPHIIRLLDFGETDFGGGNKVLFMVMDYAPNGSLQDRHAKGSQLLLSTVISYIKQIASGLQYAHDHKIVHRDIKPGNIFIGNSNEILIGDFGIAVTAHRTQTMQLQIPFGTPGYAAPEQYQGAARPASDQYAVGVMVYEWLSGTLPLFPLQVKIPTISPTIEQIMLKALAKDPKQRFPSIQEFAQALEKAYLSLQAPTAINPQHSSIGTSVPLQKVSTSRIGDIYFTFTGHTSAVYSIAWSADGSHIMSSSQDSVHIWEVSTGKSKIAYPAKTIGNIAASSWSFDELYVALAVSDTVQVWDIQNGTKVFTYGGHFHVVNTVAWSPDGIHITSGSTDGEMHIWDITTGFTVLKMPGLINIHQSSDPWGSSPQPQGPGAWGSFQLTLMNPDNILTWSPDGKYIVVSNAQQVKILDISNGTMVADLYDNRLQIRGFAISPDKQWIAAGIDTGTGSIYGGQVGVQVREVSTNRAIFFYSGHKDYVKVVAWSPRQVRIASGGDDRTVQVWDALSGKNVFTYRGHSNNVNALAWSPNGQYIASADLSGRIQVWRAA